MFNYRRRRRNVPPSFNKRAVENWKSIVYASGYVISYFFSNRSAGGFRSGAKLVFCPLLKSGTLPGERKKGGTEATLNLRR